MGNSRYYQFLYSKTPMLSCISGSIAIGSTGAVGTVTGNGLKATTPVVRLTTGLYTIALAEPYNAYVNFEWACDPGVTGSAIAAGSLVTGTPYQITVMGTTTQANWVTAGFNTAYTAAVGKVFVAVGTTSGNGTATAISKSSVASIEVVNPQTMLAGTNVTTAGALFTLQTLDFANALVDPASGSVINFTFWLRNSSNSK